VPPQDGARCDLPVRPQSSGQAPDQRGEDRPVGPVEARCGLARRSTTTSCRGTSSSAFLDTFERLSRISQPESRRRSGAAGRGTWLIIMSAGLQPPNDPGHRSMQTLGTRQGQRAGRACARYCYRPTAAVPPLSHDVAEPAPRQAERPEHTSGNPLPIRGSGQHEYRGPARRADLYTIR
jgi:hypothetical protein